MAEISAEEKDSRRRYQQKVDAATDELVDALCQTYARVTGRVADDRMRDELWQAVRFDL